MCYRYIVESEMQICHKYAFLFLSLTGGIPMPAKSKKIFISYAHESDDFRENVRELANWLTSKGQEVITDHQYEDRPPPQGWQAWMQHGVEDSDVVLVICSPTYKSKFDKRKKHGGAIYEGAIITQDLYDASLWNEKFFPVLPDAGNYKDVPKILRPFFNNHRFDSGNERILKLIEGEKEMLPPVASSDADGVRGKAGGLFVPFRKRIMFMCLLVLSVLLYYTHVSIQGENKNPAVRETANTSVLLTELQDKKLYEDLEAAESFQAAQTENNVIYALERYNKVLGLLSQEARNQLDNGLLEKAITDEGYKHLDDAAAKYRALFSLVLQKHYKQRKDYRP
jgi:hypothetical protein